MARWINKSFRAWMKATKLRAGDVAKMLGKARSTIYAYRNGHYDPDLDTAVAIEQASGGVVKVESWGRK